MEISGKCMWNCSISLFKGQCLTTPLLSTLLCLVQTSPSQLIMPGRNDKLPIVPHQGEAVEMGTSMGPLTLAKVEEDMATAIIAVCTMTRNEDLSHVLLPEHVRCLVLLKQTLFCVPMHYFVSKSGCKRQIMQTR
jgi:hypothetical protein